MIFIQFFIFGTPLLMIGNEEEKNDVKIFRMKQKQKIGKLNVKLQTKPTTKTHQKRIKKIFYICDKSNAEKNTHVNI